MTGVARSVGQDRAVEEHNLQCQKRTNHVRSPRRLDLPCKILRNLTKVRIAMVPRRIFQTRSLDSHVSETSLPTSNSFRFQLHSRKLRHRIPFVTAVASEKRDAIQRLQRRRHMGCDPPICQILLVEEFVQRLLSLQFCNIYSRLWRPATANPSRPKCPQFGDSEDLSCNSGDFHARTPTANAGPAHARIAVGSCHRHRLGGMAA